MKPFSVFRFRGNTDVGARSTINISADTTILTSVTSTTQATASVTVNSDGTTTVSSFGANPAWHHAPAAGLGASFWAIVTLTSGSVTSGTVASRVQLTTGASWACVTTGTGTVRTKSAIGTIELWDAASGGNMVSSGTFSITASVEASQSNSGGGGDTIVDPGTDGDEMLQ